MPGGWIAPGTTVQLEAVKELVKTAFEAGINYFDTAEGYLDGQSEATLSV
jgi:aryl-alcohol dehydrogenase-like predicted oxidoreductase